MHKRRLIQYALAGLAGLTIPPLAAAAAGQAADDDLPLLVAGMDAAYPPFGFKDSKTGEFVGFDVDIIRAIGRTAGFRVKVENIPFDGLIPALKTRTIDIAINDIGITAERAKSVDFSDRYYIAGMGIVVAKGYQGIQSAKDLEGKRLAVTIGSTGEIAAKRIPHAQVRVFNTLSDCFLEAHQQRRRCCAQRHSDQRLLCRHCRRRQSRLALYFTRSRRSRHCRQKRPQGPAPKDQ